jgi:hypothetical protein
MKQQCNYSVACGTPEVVREPRRSDAREPVSVLTEQIYQGVPPGDCNTGKKGFRGLSASTDRRSEASMSQGERPGKCRNKDNVKGPIANTGRMKGLLARRGFSLQ